ncbi:MAG TPA: hypothetical protein P5119_10650 [Candidatus Aminicenantes bacterium]|nr:hypothetical protein [Candidatus Aminicenantes bacterium]HRY65784.1 hypothetical protein [Candidatus Aminicenantes bacterium]HRZ72698.1 hypothetical protein [Candidatus Aminicenantes bacterium]
MEVGEHYYADDPARGPADAKTTLAGVEYFFLGNGLIQAAVQAAPAGEGTPVGLLVMDPERFGVKRAALSFDPETGLLPTAMSIVDRDGTHAARPGAVRAGWRPGADGPQVEIVWRSGPYRVTELFLCPDTDSARLERRVSVERSAAGTAAVRLLTGLPGRTAEARLSFRGKAAGPVRFEYRLTKAAGRPALRLRVAPAGGGESGGGGSAAAYWRGTAEARFHDPLLDRFFAASKHQLRAAVSAAGRLDGSIWQYNLEWVRDQSFIVLALAMSGQAGLARTILDRLLREFISDQGAPMDSSRFRPWQESEVDQNGVLLFALESYVNWTGDLDLVKEHWDRIARAAAFPLRPVFRHGPSGLLLNRREFWERHGAHGLQPGMELAHQMFMVMGLRAAGRLAARTGRDATSRRWTAAALDLRAATLKDPVFSLVERGTLIKRRGPDGRVEKAIRPEPGTDLPRQAPLFGPGRHWLDPDTEAALAVAWSFVDPGSRLAQRTLDSMEKLWNQRWTGGGYGRYHVSSEPDSPGPWPFASLFVARAALEAGQPAKARRVLDWLGRAPGGRAASWFEFYGPRPVPPYPQVGIIPWTWAEMIILCVHHVLGVRPDEGFVSLQPRLLPGLDHVEADLPLRGGRIELQVRRARRGEKPRFESGGRRAAFHRYGFGLELPPRFDRVVIRAIIP